MTQRNEIRPASRAHRSELDHRAINVTGHMLFAIVGIERRLASVPEQFSALVEIAGRSTPIGHLRIPVGTGATGNQS